MTGVGRRRVWVEQCLHAPGTSDRPHDGSPLLAAELVPSIATQDGTANSPRVAKSNHKELTDAVPDLGTCRMPDISSPSLERKGEKCIGWDKDELGNAGESKRASLEGSLRGHVN
jgi:hypothetical protein